MFAPQGSGREPDPGADRGGLRGVEKVLEREREPREPERNHRSSTTRAVAGGASGRLREPTSAAAPSPVGKHMYKDWECGCLNFERTLVPL